MTAVEAYNEMENGRKVTHLSFDELNYFEMLPGSTHITNRSGMRVNETYREMRDREDLACWNGWAIFPHPFFASPTPPSESIDQFIDRICKLLNLDELSRELKELTPEEIKELTEQLSNDDPDNSNRIARIARLGFRVFANEIFKD